MKKIVVPVSDGQYIRLQRQKALDGYKDKAWLDWLMSKEQSTEYRFDIQEFKRLKQKLDDGNIFHEQLPDGSIMTYHEDKLYYRNLFFLLIRNDASLYYELYSKDSVENRRFYNIGAGSFRHKAWTNVDHVSEYYAEKQSGDFIEWDLLSLTSIPVKSNSAEIVYCSHTIEHITNDAAQNMFNEVYRILKKDGFFRVTTPNIDLEYRAYKEKDKRYFHWVMDKDLPLFSIQQLFLSHFATNASISDDEFDRIFSEMEYEEALNHCISKCSIEEQKKHPGNHINWWNASKLFKMLKIAGFNNIHLSGYGQSFSPVLREIMIFDNTFPKISLYVEAIK